MIDLHVDGEPGQVRQAARLMKSTVPDQLDAAADAAGSGSGAGWTGQAGSAYRSTARDVGTGGDAVARASRMVGSKLTALADELVDLEADMKGFAADAESHDLVVNDEVIETPGAAVPVPALPAGADAQQREQHGRLTAAHDAQAAKIRAYERLRGEVERRRTEHTRWTRSHLGELPGLVDEALEEVPSIVLKLTAAGVDSAFNSYGDALRQQARHLESQHAQERADRKHEDPSAREAREEARERRRIEALGKDADSAADAARKLSKALDLLDKGPLNALDLATGSPLAKVLAEELGSSAAAGLALRALAAAGLAGAPLTAAGIAAAIGGGLAADAAWDALPPEVKDKLSLGKLLEGLGSDGGGGDPQVDPSPRPTPTPSPSATPAEPWKPGLDKDPEFSQPSPYEGDPEFSQPFTKDGPRGAVSA